MMKIALSLLLMVQQRCCVYMIKHKLETLRYSKCSKDKVKNQLGKRIRHSRSKWDSEYLSQRPSDHLRNCVIVLQFSPSNTPQYGGMDDRSNRTFLDMVRSMMSRVMLRIGFWSHTSESDTHVLNLVPTKMVSKTLSRMWSRVRTLLAHKKVWGCKTSNL